jgi:hypothetical protein
MKNIICLAVLITAILINPVFGALSDDQGNKLNGHLDNLDAAEAKILAVENGEETITADEKAGIITNLEAAATALGSSEYINAVKGNSEDETLLKESLSRAKALLSRAQALVVAPTTQEQQIEPPEPVASVTTAPAEIDASSFVTKTELEEKTSDFITKDEAAKTYATKDEVKDLIHPQIGDTATEEELNSAAENRATPSKDVLGGTIAVFVFGGPAYEWQRVTPPAYGNGVHALYKYNGVWWNYLSAEYRKE